VTISLTRKTKSLRYNQCQLQKITTKKNLSFFIKIHTKMVGSHSIDIDYININILFVYVEHILLDSVLPNEQFDNQTKKKSAIIELNKFF
jgi:hypothetical protein